MSRFERKVSFQMGLQHDKPSAGFHAIGIELISYRESFTVILAETRHDVRPGRYDTRELHKEEFFASPGRGFSRNIPKAVNRLWLRDAITSLPHIEGKDAENVAHALFFHLAIIPAVDDPDHWLRRHLPEMMKWWIKHFHDIRMKDVREVMES